MRNIRLLIAAMAIGVVSLGSVHVAFAAFNDVQFTAPTTNITLTDAIGSTSLVVTSTSLVESFAASTSTILIGVRSGSAMTLYSNSKRYIYLSPAMSTFACNSSSSTISITGSITQTTTLSIGDVCIPSMTASTVGSSRIDLAWSGSSASYTITNVTTGATNSTADQSFGVGGLNCGTSYTFNVKGTTSGVDSNTVTAGASTSACSSGGIAPSGGGSSNSGLVIPVTPATNPAPVNSNADAPITTPTVVPAIVAHFTQALQRGSTGDEVTALQTELAAMGFLSKKIVPNGIFGPNTQTAIRSFQRAEGLAASGKVTADTRAALNVLASIQSSPADAFRTDMATGAQGTGVKTLQQKLQALGYFPATMKVVAKFGPTTAKSVKAFQAANGLAQTGKVGPATRALLNSK